MAGTAVEDDLCAIQAQEGGGVQGGEQLFARLAGDGCIGGGQDDVSDGDLLLAGNGGGDGFDIVVLRLTALDPGGKMAHLSVQAVVGKTHLGPDEENVLVGTQDSAIVANIPMANTKAEVDEHVFADRIRDDLGEDFPGVEEGVALEVVIKTAIAWRESVLRQSAREWATS